MNRVTEWQRQALVDFIATGWAPLDQDGVRRFRLRSDRFEYFVRSGKKGSIEADEG